jgi:hypothetical protein
MISDGCCFDLLILKYEGFVLEKSVISYQEQLKANLAKDEKVFNTLNQLINELDQVEKEYLDRIKATYFFIILNGKLFDKKEHKELMSLLYLLKKLKKLKKLKDLNKLNKSNKSKKSKKLNKQLDNQFLLNHRIVDRDGAPINDRFYFGCIVDLLKVKLGEKPREEFSYKKYLYFLCLLGKLRLSMNDLIDKREVVAEYFKELKQDNLTELVEIHSYSNSMLGLNARRDGASFFVLLSAYQRREPVAAAINRHCFLGRGGTANVFKVIIRESTGCYKWVALKLVDSLNISFSSKLDLDCKDLPLNKVAAEAYDVFEYLGFDPYGVGYWRGETPFYIIPIIGEPLAKEAKDDKTSSFELDLYKYKWEIHPVLSSASLDSRLCWCIDLCSQLYVFHQDGRRHNDLTIANILFDDNKKKWFIIDSNMASDYNFVKGTSSYNSLHKRDPSEWTNFDDVMRLMALQAVILGCRPEDVYQFSRPPIEDKSGGGLIKDSCGKLSFDKLFLNINKKFNHLIYSFALQGDESADCKDLEESKRLLCEIDYDALVKRFFNRALANDFSLSISEVNIFFVTIYQLIFHSSNLIKLQQIIAASANLIYLASGKLNQNFLNKFGSNFRSSKQNNLRCIRTHLRSEGRPKQAIVHSQDNLNNGLSSKEYDDPESKEVLEDATTVPPDNLNQLGADVVSLDYSKVALCMLGFSCFPFGLFFFLPYMVYSGLISQTFSCIGFSSEKNSCKVHSSP